VAEDFTLTAAPSEPQPVSVTDMPVVQPLPGQPESGAAAGLQFAAGRARASPAGNDLSTWRNLALSWRASSLKRRAPAAKQPAFALGRAFAKLGERVVRNDEVRVRSPSAHSDLKSRRLPQSAEIGAFLNILLPTGVTHWYVGNGKNLAVW